MKEVAKRAGFAVTHPELLYRRMRRMPTIDISLTEISQYVESPALVVEAGALDGSDTVRMATHWPAAHIHAFEPVPSAFSKLQFATENHERVTTYRLALSDRTGHQTMNISSGPQGQHRPDSSSLLTPTGHLASIPEVTFNQQITVETSTLDEWRSAFGIQFIDFMWLDLQGMELPVLQHSVETIADTRAIMMEVSRREMYAGSDLYPDVMSWMQRMGFRPAIDRVSYSFGNILFVRAQS